MTQTSTTTTATRRGIATPPQHQSRLIPVRSRASLLLERKNGVKTWSISAGSMPMPSSVQTISAP